MKQIKTSRIGCTYISALITIASLLIGGCDSKSGNGDDYAETVAAKLPLLGQGSHAGFIVGFNASNPPATEASIQARWEEAIGVGMSIARVQVSWKDLEPHARVYDTQLLEERLQAYSSQGMAILLSITAYDSEDPEPPEDISDLKFDNAILITRFNALMDKIVPLMERHGVFALSIANEPDNGFDEIQNLENEILTFLKQVKSHIRALNNDIAVTVTLAEGNLDFNKPGMSEIISASDIACWNIYGMNLHNSTPYFLVQNESEILADLQEMVDASMGKQIVVQEVGLHAGSAILDSSEEAQRRFYEIFFQFMQDNPQIRAAYAFQLVDWSPETVEIYINPEDGDGIYSAYSEHLLTLGLINYSDGSAKPAWNEFLRWLSVMAAK
jgi:hypothetical protein